jgi:16S rRNA (guanine527-N7)-methyltransferase
LAGLWPDAEAVLVDSSERRTGFLAESVTALGWDGRVQVVRLRAEEYGRLPDVRGAADAVVARGFAPPPVTAECAAPLLRVGGLLVVSEPPDELARWAPEGMAALGMGDPALVVAGARYQSVRQVTACPDRYPRRVGIPAKRPLW